MTTYLGLSEFRDIVENVLYKYLDPIIVHQLFPQVFEKCLIHHINKRLKGLLGDTYDKFMEIFNREKLVLSGSFILQCIHDEYYHSDIDIFSDHLAYAPPLHIRQNTTDYFKDLYICDNGKNRVFHYLNSLQLINVDMYKINGDDVPLQVIHLNPSLLYKDTSDPDKYIFIDKVFEYIKQQFDFDVCANIFYSENGIHKVKIYNFNNCINKIIDLRNINTNTINMRIEKYRRRGFNFLCDHKIPTVKRIFVANDEKLDVGTKTVDIEPGIYELVSFVGGHFTDREKLKPEDIITKVRDYLTSYPPMETWFTKIKQ